jgi:TetR/AcrR family transcriptional regulator
MVKSSGQARPAAADQGTEGRILDAAHVVFMRRGTAGARMQEIAREAGVNSALLHYYFRSKERLSEAVFRRAAANLLPAVLEVLASDREIEDKVEAVIDIELSRLLKTPYLPGYILSELAHHPERIRQLVSAVTGMIPEDVGREVLVTLRKQINARVRSGTFHPIEPEQFVINLLSLCVFPFAARPMVSLILGLDDAGFERFIARRRRELPAFFLRALRQ